jgi:hypothetical protein
MPRRMSLSSENTRASRGPMWGGPGAKFVAVCSGDSLSLHGCRCISGLDVQVHHLISLGDWNDVISFMH